MNKATGNIVMEVVNMDFLNPFIDVPGWTKKKRSLSGFSKMSGCYMIKENESIVYIGMSQSCVVEALYRHFYQWNDKRGNNLRVTYYDKLKKKKYSAVIIVTPKEQAPKLEQSLIITLNPRDNKEMYDDVIDMILVEKGYKKSETSSPWDNKEPLEDLPF